MKRFPALPHARVSNRESLITHTCDHFNVHFRAVIRETIQRKETVSIVWKGHSLGILYSSGEIHEGVLKQVPNTHEISLTRLLKCVIGCCVYAASILAAFLQRLTGELPPGRCVVLYYHSIPADQRERFARQLDTVIALTKPLDAAGKLRLQPGVRYSAITFDDAFENFLQEALPELQKRNIPSLVFVITDALDKAFGPVEYSEKVMSTQQLLSLPADLVHLGSHTSSHPYLPNLTDQDAARELIQSKLTLERLLNHDVETFSFPFGGFTPKLVELCWETGYKRIFTTLPEFSFFKEGDYVFGRVRVDPTDWALEFRLKLTGAYNWLPRAFALKKRLKDFITGRRRFAGQRPSIGSGDRNTAIREWTGR